MKVIVVFLFAAVVVAYALEDKEVLKQWSEFKSTYGKSYKSSAEAERRLAIFRENLNGIEQHNAQFKQGNTTYKKGINHFADWTKAEFLQYVNKGLVNKPIVTGPTFNASKKFVAPNEVDWRNHNAVTRIKFQGKCGACWAFSATGSLEGQLGLNGTLVSLSEQNLVDCSTTQGNDGCDGGHVEIAFDYIKSNGIENEADYPYEAKNDTCRSDISKQVYKLAGYATVLKNSESDLQQVLATKGPISVYIDATDNLQMYKSGIFQDPTCSSGHLNHAVLAVGYGIENGVLYYIVKNSWGEKWGEKGYFRLIRNQNNQCGIASRALFPIL